MVSVKHDLQILIVFNHVLYNKMHEKSSPSLTIIDSNEGHVSFAKILPKCPQQEPRFTYIQGMKIRNPEHVTSF